jgi:uncharacterized membrane protein
MYLLGKELRNASVGLMASFITALNFFHVQYSQEVRFYVLLFLLTALSYLFFIKAYRNPSLLNYFFYTIVSIALAYTHYFGPVVIIAQGVTFLVLAIFRKRELKFILLSILSGIIILLAYIPWFSVIFAHAQITEFWAQRPDPFFWALYYYVYLGKDPYLGLLYLVFIFLFVRYVIRLRKQQDIHARAERGWHTDLLIIIAVCVLVCYLVPYLYSITQVPILDAKYTIIVLPILFGAIAWGWSVISSRQVRRILLATIVISTCINFAFFNKYYHSVRKEQLREAARYVMQSDQKGDPVYGRLAWFFNYYFTQYNSGIKAINPTDGNADALNLDFGKELAGKQKLWVLQGHLVTALTPQQQQYLDEHFQVDKKFDLFYAYAYHYVRK